MVAIIIILFTLRKRPASHIRQPGAGLVLSASPWCSPIKHKQYHRALTSDKTILVTMMDEDKNKTTP